MTGRTELLRTQARRHEAELQARARRRRLLVPLVVTSVVVVVVTLMMLSSRPTSTGVSRVAPGFTLTATDGTQVRLSDFRGRTVLLYFSEGAGCGACLQQMAAIEKDRSAFATAGVTVLPIVMNSRQDILRDMRTYGATTPFLLDDGTVSKAYGTLGHGMHAGLPGHSFVLVDKDGMQRWYGEYPSMWLAPSDLLAHVRAHLPA